MQVTMTGQNEVRRIRIDDALMAEDRDMLEDVVAAAVNDTMRKVKKVVSSRNTPVWVQALVCRPG